ncbi:hypothetical protein EAH78_25590 [Pseudomonas arsenicoxydans]|uniref:Uncharacterized protein n=1 Tax=Pseudomonas arsenicoxydans TaxID=702115 RepID=A0A502HJB1_9PSED|nr:hypothetical protein EAH78_25590 [Pseudomonas arsenicoxydans]
MLSVAASSRASPAPTGCLVYTKFAVGFDPLWERACSRRRPLCQWRCKLCRPLREQARSHT